MKKIPFSILKRLNRVFRPEYSVVRRQGIRLLLNKNNWIDNRILSFRPYEKRNVNFMIGSIKEHGFDRFIDVGANIGVFSVMAAMKTDIGKIMAFEPISKNYYQFCANILLNDLQGRVNPIQNALSDTSGKTEIFYDVNSTGIGTLQRANSVRKDSDYNRSEMITCIRFDDLYDIKGEKIFIKMDVEQHESAALAGMQQFLSRNKIWLMLEINNETSPVIDQLRSYGFHKMNTDTDDHVFANF